MKKIKSLFKRNYEGDRLVYNEIVEGSEWVLKDEGIATRKYDGTACMVKLGKLYKRYDIKDSNKIPENAILCNEVPDIETNHWPCWIPVGNKNEDKYFREAFTGNELDGTYELCGPKVNGNKEKFDKHILIPHGKDIIEECPREFNLLKEWLKDKDIEGIVWHRENGDMVKIKKKDFGYKR